MSPTRPPQIARKSTGGNFPKKQLATQTKGVRKPAKPPQVDAPGTSAMAPPQTQATLGLVSSENLRAELFQHCASVSTYIGWSDATIQNLKKELELALKERDKASQERDSTLKELKDFQKDYVDTVGRNKEDDGKLASMNTDVSRLRLIQASYESELESVQLALSAQEKEVEELRAASDEAVRKSLAEAEQELRVEFEEKLKVEWAAREEAIRKELVETVKKLRDIGCIDLRKYLEYSNQKKQVAKEALVLLTIVAALHVLSQLFVDNVVA